MEDLKQKKVSGVPIVGLTAYDFPTAQLMERVGMDLILVGDSAGPMLLGHSSADETTVAEMVMLGRAVVRGAPQTRVVIDMPLSAYHGSLDDSLQNARRILEETGAWAVKIEGGRGVVPVVQRLADASLAVVAHLSDEHQAEDLPETAGFLEESGASAIVLVHLRPETAMAVTQAVTIPTIGYLSGPYCDGQLYVTPRLVGLVPTDTTSGPYLDVARQYEHTFARFRDDVRRSRFPR